jgi:hypothetical protein
MLDKANQPSGRSFGDHLARDRNLNASAVCKAITHR